MTSNENRLAWEDWSEVDPLWAIVTAPGREGGGWDLESFFASGQATVDDLWAHARALGLPNRSRRALDFGGGVGRLTRALGNYVDHVVGVDISEGMISLARRYNAELPTIDFRLLSDAPLETFESGHFDVVCCLLVLQHIPSVQVIEDSLGQLIRLMAPGGVLMLQMPTEIKIDAAQVASASRRDRLTERLRKLGVKPKLLYRYLKWRPAMPMTAVPDERIRELIEVAGAQIVWTCPIPDEVVEQSLYLATR
jgi:SAM-dependent methyltransferase